MVGREPQSFVANARHVQVQRDHEPSAIDLIPSAGVDAVLAREPAQEEEQSFAGAALGRVRQQVFSQIALGSGSATPVKFIELPRFFNARTKAPTAPTMSSPPGSPKTNSPSSEPCFSRPRLIARMMAIMSAAKQKRYWKLPMLHVARARPCAREPRRADPREVQEPSSRPSLSSPRNRKRGSSRREPQPRDRPDQRTALRGRGDRASACSEKLQAE